MAQQDSIAKPKVSNDSGIVVAKDTAKPVKLFNPVVASVASIVFPGAGQIYTGHYVMSGLFILAEAGIGLYGYQQYVYTAGLKHIADSLGALYASHKNWKRPGGDTTMIDSAFYFKLEADSAKMEKQHIQNNLYQSAAWMLGVYYFNVLDALGSSGIFKNDSHKDATTAIWLSAIPGLGLGQIYNGELSKAGFIFMTQCNLAMLAINEHLLMKLCEDYEASISPSNADQYSLFTGAQHDRWDYVRTTAFKNRNMYIWYSLGFWLYGIFDAAVDAHLHDAKIKMKLEPDLVPETREIGLRASIDF